MKVTFSGLFHVPQKDIETAIRVFRETVPQGVHAGMARNSTFNVPQFLEPVFAKNLHTAGVDLSQVGYNNFQTADVLLKTPQKKKQFHNPIEGFKFPANGFRNVFVIGLGLVSTFLPIQDKAPNKIEQLLPAEPKITIEIPGIIDKIEDNFILRNGVSKKTKKSRPVYLGYVDPAPGVLGDRLEVVYCPPTAEKKALLIVKSWGKSYEFSATEPEKGKFFLEGEPALTDFTKRIWVKQLKEGQYKPFVFPE